MSKAHEYRTKYKQHGDRANLMRNAASAVSARAVACWNRLFSRRTVNFWMGFFTFVLTVVTVLQWSVMRDQNDIMQIQLKQAETALRQTDDMIGQVQLEQRPWIAAQRPTLEPITSKTPPAANVVLINNGRTPAFIYFSVLDILVGPDDTAIPLAMKMQKGKAPELIREEIISPGGNMRIYTAEKMLLREEDVLAVQSGDKRLFLIGVILYRGAFDVLHETRYCFVYNADRNALFLNPRHQYMDTNHQKD